MEADQIDEGSQSDRCVCRWSKKLPSANQKNGISGKTSSTIFWVFLEIFCRSEFECAFLLAGFILLSHSRRLLMVFFKRRWAFGKRWWEHGLAERARFFFVRSTVFFGKGSLGNDWRGWGSERGGGGGAAGGATVRQPSGRRTGWGRLWGFAPAPGPRPGWTSWTVARCYESCPAAGTWQTSSELRVVRNLKRNC